MSDSDFELKSYVATLPQRPGVYRMYAADGELLYVGKAARLRDRVGSYFVGHDLAPKVAAMARRIDRDRGDGRQQRARSAAARVQSDQGPSAALQHHVARRQIVPVHPLSGLGHEFPRLVFYRGPRRSPTAACSVRLRAPMRSRKCCSTCRRCSRSETAATRSSPTAAGRACSTRSDAARRRAWA